MRNYYPQFQASTAVVQLISHLGLFKSGSSYSASVPRHSYEYGIDKCCHRYSPSIDSSHRSHAAGDLPCLESLVGLSDYAANIPTFSAQPTGYRWTCPFHDDREIWAQKVLRICPTLLWKPGPWYGKSTSCELTTSSEQSNLKAVFPKHPWRLIISYSCLGLLASRKTGGDSRFLSMCPNCLRTVRSKTHMGQSVMSFPETRCRRLLTLRWFWLHRSLLKIATDCTHFIQNKARVTEASKWVSQTVRATDECLQVRQDLVLSNTDTGGLAHSLWSSGVSQITQNGKQSLIIDTKFTCELEDSLDKGVYWILLS